MCVCVCARTRREGKHTEAAAIEESTKRWQELLSSTQAERGATEEELGALAAQLAQLQQAEAEQKQQPGLAHGSATLLGEQRQRPGVPVPSPRPLSKLQTQRACPRSSCTCISVKTVFERNVKRLDAHAVVFAVQRLCNLHVSMYAHRCARVRRVACAAGRGAVGREGGDGGQAAAAGGRRDG